ncbi:hypothetical protein ANANG_G00141590 [Anguilla anguilla]|uniref:Uncharacterized protein n=1 Tax=Anguilla anguilla TaxID=7936 RepID=A0A9D3MAV3_ANGAN|nr:hypothetical protein ANANG_G00141590 [Anguilla anguilla]
MEGYALSEDELFSSCLHNFTWENAHDQPGNFFLASVERIPLPLGRGAAPGGNADGTCRSHLIRRPASEEALWWLR